MSTSIAFDESLLPQSEEERQRLSDELKIQRAADNALVDLYTFVKLFWEVLEPDKPFIDALHILAICDHLEACTDGRIKKLNVNVPPGHAKSLIISVFWPVWVWCKKPGKKFIFGSYADDLSVRDSIKRRDLIKSQKFQYFMKPKWKFTDDTNRQDRFANTAMGYMIATSVGGSGTGERADFMIGDDPLNAVHAESEANRKKANDWWLRTMSTRGTDPSDSVWILVMQRLHEKDPSGEWQKENPGVVSLFLPTEYVPPDLSKPQKVSPIGWKDWRTTEGELLWPEVYSKEVIVDTKRTLGSRAFSSQHNQKPQAANGGLFKRIWWKLWDERPMGHFEIVQFVDCAAKPGISNDNSVIATWMKTPTGLYLLDLVKIKVAHPQLLQAVNSAYLKWKPNAVVIEDKSAGTSVIQHFQQDSTMAVIPFNPGQNDKQVRASAATPTVEAGNCFLPSDAEWLEDFLDEHEKFPLAAHDDQVDTTSMMVWYWVLNRNFAQPRVRQL